MASAGKTKGPSERLRGRGFRVDGIQGSGESDLQAPGPIKKTDSE